MRAATAFVVFFLAVAFCLAQFDMDMGKMYSRPSIAFTREDIKKELKLRKDQNGEISKILKEMNGSLNGASGDMAAAMTGLKKFDEADTKILAVLDEPQKKRFFEIQLQIQGPPAAANPTVAETLKLTEDQVGQITKLQSTYQSDAMSLMQKADRSTMGKIEKLRDDRDKKIFEVMSVEQQAKFKEMQGAVFKNARPKGMF